MKGIRPNCNLCGDYEYCAFDFDHCTGFIPGDNYVPKGKQKYIDVQTGEEIEIDYGDGENL